MLMPIVSPYNPPAVLTYIAETSDEANLTTYTFSSHAIGTASSDRFVIVVATGDRNGANDISSVTIGGNAATLLVKSNDSAGFNIIGAYGLLVTSGTTADIVVTFSTAQNRAGIMVFTATKLKSTTPSETDTSTAAPGSFSATCANGGFVLAASTIQTATSYTWTNASELVDVTIGIGPVIHSAARTTTAGTATITATPASGTTRIATIGVAMR